MRQDAECPYCLRNFVKRHPMYATCGHPRCVRTHRAHKAKGYAKKPAKPKVVIDRDAPDILGQERIKTAMRAAIATGMDDSQAVYAVAAGLKERPAAVLSVWRAA